MDVEDDGRWHDKLRNEERASLPIGFSLGALVGGANALLRTMRERELGETLDLLRGEGLLDDELSWAARSRALRAVSGHGSWSGHLPTPTHIGIVRVWDHVAR